MARAAGWKVLYAVRRRAGLCVRCGRPAVAGRSRCAEHAARDAANARAYDEAHREAHLERARASYYSRRGEEQRGPDRDDALPRTTGRAGTCDVCRRPCADMWTNILGGEYVLGHEACVLGDLRAAGRA